ncbi:MAG: glycogen synthase GlgA [Syntrophaceae bacterium]|nr:glycogen synthase GlgA [Syntrophaceae bacterium]
MGKSLNILMIASEVEPFAKVGGLADVVGAIPKALAARGHDVRIVMPRYYRVDRQALALQPTGGPLGVPMGALGEKWCAVLTGYLPGTDIPVHFIEHEHYYGRDGLYQQSGIDFSDNAERFLFLSRAGLEFCRMSGFKPHIVHAHDWHTALVPVLLNTVYRHDSILEDAVSLLTIHNLQHQGIFPKEFMNTIGIGWQHFHSRDLEYYDQVNCLKGGIYHADIINTVSPTYAGEIQQPEYGYGLDGVIRDRSEDLYGILNGIDYEVWNPAADPMVHISYDAGNPVGKQLCKKDLQQISGLLERDDVPLIGMVTRLVEQKGIDVLAQAIHTILGLDLQMVILGSGEPWAHEYFRSISDRNKGKFSFMQGYSDAMAHKIIAGSDFFLIPSRFEPCGLTQMYAMRYGTIPIVRATGGLNDTVENFDEPSGTGTGFKFWDLSASALEGTIRWALEKGYHNPETLKILRLRIMGKRFPWKESAEEYEDLYIRAIENSRTHHHPLT